MNHDFVGKPPSVEHITDEIYNRLHDVTPEVHHSLSMPYYCFLWASLRIGDRTIHLYKMGGKMVIGEPDVGMIRISELSYDEAERRVWQGDKE